MTYKYIIRVETVVSMALEYRFPLKQNLGFHYIGTAVSVPRNCGVKSPGILMNRCTCWAHIRRYLLEAIPKGHDKDYTNPAVQGVLYCDKFFEYERTYKEKNLSFKQIQNRRLKDQKPVIEGFLLWAKQLDPGSNGKLKKAKTYILNRENYLMTYLEDGRCSLSNNLSENSICPVTVGRKNWLFSDSPDGATANAMYLTIVEMAKAYDLNLYEYLKFLLEHRLNENMTDEELDHLAPWSIDVQEQCSIK